MQTELGVKQELELLQDLQALDLRLQELRDRVEHVPKQVEDVDEALEANQSILEQAQAIVEEQQREQRQNENEVAALREQLSRYKTQLMEVKTNKEYQAMLHEIETTERRIETREDQILELMLAAEDRLEEARVLEREFETKDRDLRLSRKQAEAFSAEAAAEIEKLTEQREALASAVPASRLAQYERIARARGGRAVSRIIDGSCQVCNVVLRKQLIAEVKTLARIASCEACNRILYYSAD